MREEKSMEQVHPAAVDMDTMALRPAHIRILAVASAGQFLGGALAILVGVIVPLVTIIRGHGFSFWLQSMVSSAGLTGIMIGSLVFGRFSDRYGYRTIFKGLPLLILAASAGMLFSHSIGVLILCLFGIGFAIGGGYALDPSYVSELMPVRWKTRMLGVSKGFAALGNISMILIAYFVLKDWPDPAEWNKLFWFFVAVAGVVFLARLPFAESPEWLASRDRLTEAEKSVRHFLGNDVTLGALAERAAAKPKTHRPWRSMFARAHIKKVILSGIPWGCEGMGVYGIGIFTPVLVLALGLIPEGASPFVRVTDSLLVTFYINLAVLAGFVIGIALVHRVNPIRDQAIGFFASAAGLLIVLAGYLLHAPVGVTLTGFLLFELALNAGPHMMTFILPSRIFDLSVRAEGEGVASAFGKLGAIIATFIIPPLMHWGGGALVLGVAAAVLVLGGIVTAVVGPQVLKKPADVK